MLTLTTDRKASRPGEHSGSDLDAPSWQWVWLCVLATSMYVSLLLALRNSRHLQILVLVAQYLVVLPLFALFLARFRDVGKNRILLPQTSVFAAVFAFALLAGMLGWFTANGLLNPDESGYSFAARTFLSGRIMAEPLPGAPLNVKDTPVAVRYESHILRPYGWFTHFPPGWPLLLSVGYWSRISWLLNPLLSLALLLLTAAIARRCFSVEASGLAAIIAVLSPFFLVNSVSRMSHMFCAVLTAGACLLLFRGLHNRSLWPFLGMFTLLAINFQVRPYTALALTAVLGLAALWYVRDNRHLLVGVMLSGLLFGSVTVAAVMFYNRMYTGSVLISPYALFAGASSPPELSLNPVRIAEGLRVYGRRSFQETLFSTFPFVFLLAGCALFLEKHQRRETLILAALYPALILAYLLHPSGSGIFYGERFHFEAFWAVAILGARGLQLLAQKWSKPDAAWVVVFLSLASMQITQQAIVASVVLSKSSVYRQVKESLEYLGPPTRLVFLQPSDEFVPKHFNLNEADWQRARLVYLIDPGPNQRSEWACRFRRPEWVVVRYDVRTRSVQQETGHSECHNL